MFKNVLITGAGGFIGSTLAEKCVELGCNVKAFVHYNSQNHWGWLEESKYRNEMEVLAGDVRDYDSLYSVMNGCDSVFHLAALIGIPYSYLSPHAYIQANVLGTYNVLQASKEQGIENIHVTSTSETYGTAQYVPIDENHPLVGQSPYAATKIAADQLAISYHRSFGLPVKIVRPFNTYGPRQSARAIIPTVISQLLSNKRTLKVGNLHPTRDLTFVSDTAEGFIEIAKSDKLFGEVTNIGLNEEISIKELIMKIREIMNSDAEIITEQERIRPSESEVERLLCDNSKIMKYTEWRPKYELDKGLEETIDFITMNLTYYKTEIYNV